MNIASFIDHSFLRPTTTIADIELLCSEAKEFGFRAVCIPPLFVKMAKEILKGSSVKVSTVTGFPFGYSAIEAKLAETVLALVDGADEIEMLANITAIKNADWQYLAKEINTIMPVVKSKGIVMKVILETGLLDETEIITCCDIYGAAGVDYVKTSTGFSTIGATVKAISLLRTHLADTVKINASGSVNTFQFALKLLEAGASTISPDESIQLVKEAKVVL